MMMFEPGTQTCQNLKKEKQINLSKCFNFADPCPAESVWIMLQRCFISSCYWILASKENYSDIKFPNSKPDTFAQKSFCSLCTHSKQSSHEIAV